jgi:hypothetical protein
VICAWCAKERKKKGLEPKVLKKGDPSNISHGICRDCKNEMMEEELDLRTTLAFLESLIESDVGQIRAAIGNLKKNLRDIKTQMNIKDLNNPLKNWGKEGEDPPMGTRKIKGSDIEGAAKTLKTLLGLLKTFRAGNISDKKTVDLISAHTDVLQGYTMSAKNRVLAKHVADALAAVKKLRKLGGYDEEIPFLDEL